MAIVKLPNHQDGIDLNNALVNLINEYNCPSLRKYWISYGSDDPKYKEIITHDDIVSMITQINNLIGIKSKNIKLEKSISKVTIVYTIANSKDFHNNDGSTVKCTMTSSLIPSPVTQNVMATGNVIFITDADKRGEYKFTLTYNGKEYTNTVDTSTGYTNYLRTFTVDETPTPTIVPWGSGTDAQIVNIINALDKGTITTSDVGWKVGDERKVNLNAISAGTYNVAHAAQQATLVIMNVGPYTDRTGHYVVGFKNCLKETEQIEVTNTNANGWHGSRGKKCCDAIFNMIPSSISGIFKNFTAYAAIKGGTDDPGILGSYGKLALFAEKEIVGNTVNYATSSEHNCIDIQQIKYYETAANRIKKLGDNGSVDYWFERSPFFNATTSFCYVDDKGAARNGAGASATFGFAPFGVI